MNLERKDQEYLDKYKEKRKFWEKYFWYKPISDEKLIEEIRMNGGSSTHYWYYPNCDFSDTFNRLLKLRVLANLSEEIYVSTDDAMALSRIIK